MKWIVILVIAAIFLAFCGAMCLLTWWWMALSDKKHRLDGILSVVDPIEFNEWIISQDTKGMFGGSTKASRDLIEHPTIKCRFTSGRHGIRPAVWRRDMSIPECRRCYVEDPYI